MNTTINNSTGTPQRANIGYINNPYQQFSNLFLHKITKTFEPENEQQN